MIHNISAALDNDVVYADTINIFLDAEDDMDYEDNLNEV